MSHFLSLLKYYKLVMRINYVFYLGPIDEFKPDSENITTYLEKIDLFFIANDVAEDKKVPVLLSCIGPKTYSILKNLTAFIFIEEHSTPVKQLPTSSQTYAGWQSTVSSMVPWMMHYATRSSVD